MAETLTKLVIDCSTGIVEEVELTAEEVAQREADAAAYAVAQAEHEAEEQAKADAKAAAIEELKALGLSDAAVAALAG